MHALILNLVSYTFEDPSAPFIDSTLKKKKKQLWVIKLNQLPWCNEDLEEKVTFLNKKE